MGNENLLTKLAGHPKSAFLEGNKKEYICDLCGRILYSRSGIRRHISHKHLGLPSSSSVRSKTEICTICGVYTTKRNFRDHVNSHSTARDFKCDICGSAVKSIYTLRKHMIRVHLKGEKYDSSLPADTQNECSTCGKKLFSAEGLRKHEKRYHTNNLIILCEICGKKSLTSAENNHHMKIHSFERKFQCDFCEHRFATSDSLKNHLIKHKGEWSYKCGLCTKIFKHSSSVSGHRKSHKVDGYYHCGCCDDRFSDYGQLKNHFVHKNHRFIS